jgi:hypothetical protein
MCRVRERDYTQSEYVAGTRIAAQIPKVLNPVAYYTFMTTQTDICPDIKFELSAEALEKV